MCLRAYDSLFLMCVHACVDVGQPVPNVSVCVGQLVPNDQYIVITTILSTVIETVTLVISINHPRIDYAMILAKVSMLFSHFILNNVGSFL